MGPPNPKQFKGEDSLARTPERNTTERKDREEQENPRERNFQPPTKQGTLSPPPPPEQCWAGRANVCLCEKKFFCPHILVWGGKGGCALQENAYLSFVGGCKDKVALFVLFVLSNLLCLN